jgi:hypothetical protein
MYSYTWQDLISVGSTYGKGIPLSKVNAQICDFVSQDMYQEYPWKQTITNTANGVMPLIDGVQDYPFEAPNLMRALTATLMRTDTKPFQSISLDIVKDLAVDLVPRSFLSIRAISAQQANGLFRLESAVSVAANVHIELRVDYQINPVKVSSLTQTLWFDDRCSAVALEGLLYWVYKLADDARAGSAQTDSLGKIVGYGGQLGVYRAAINRMKMAEEYGFTESVFPSETMGAGRDGNALSIFGW